MIAAPWKQLCRHWLWGAMIMFAGNYLVLGWVDPSHNVTRAAFTGVAGTSLVLLPTVLSKVTPVGRTISRPWGFVSKSDSWWCYCFLLWAVTGWSIYLTGDTPGLRVVGASATVAGCLGAFRALRRSPETASKVGGPKSEKEKAACD